ncbi:MAG: hypothetical protein CO182_06860, partial [Lysobacterales bacterium CG_4_9_14_3_um_filter_62_6]
RTHKDYDQGNGK